MKQIGCVIAIIILVAVVFSFQFINKKLIGNKQIMDLSYNFKTAYIQMPDNTVRKVQIRRWCDYENSDSVQIIDQNDVVYYTHLNRVVLINEKE